MSRGNTEKCAKCGAAGVVGVDVMPYYLDTKVLKQGYRKRTKAGWEDVPPEKKSINAWLCIEATGRRCSADLPTYWRELAAQIWAKAEA